MNVAIFADRVENPANLARLDDAARLLGVSRTDEIESRTIVVENAPGARSIYGRRPLRDDVTLVVGNERRGVSRSKLENASEIVEIPTVSRKVTTLNVAAAAAVAGWYVLRGSSSQLTVRNPDVRRPTLLIVGDDHVEVGSSLRSAAAMGYRDLLLEDRDAGWFSGSPSVRREAYAAARRHKNAVRVHPAAIADATRFSDVVVVTAGDCGMPIQRARLARGAANLVIVGASERDIDALGDRVTRVGLGLDLSGDAPLRLIASIAIAEIARQVGRRIRVPAEPPRRPPVYEAAIPLARAGEVLVVEEADLLVF